ncbi:MAG: hypothetical protein GC205_11810 [Bacteroidetes bacterium]|nr:hypothetical protein [Bacteroidota bacterium]
MKRYSAVFSLLTLVVLSLVVHSCSKDTELSGLLVEADQIQIDSPTDTGTFTCEPWQLFYREEGEYSFRMSCAPYFNYDRVFAKAPIVRQSDRVPEGTFSGDFYALYITRPTSLSFAEAEANQSLAAQALLTPFQAEKRDGIWYCRLELDGDIVELPAVEFRISNRNDDNSVIYRAMVVWSDPSTLYQAVVFWSVLED